MIQCESYEEARLEAINLLTRMGSEIRSLRIEPCTEGYRVSCVYSDYISRLEYNREEAKRRIAELQEKIDDLEMKIAEKKKEMGL